MAAGAARSRLDGYFRELAQLWPAADPPTREDELDLMRRHGMGPV